MRSRAPVPVDLHRQREEIIIKKDDFVGGSESFLDSTRMGANRKLREKKCRRSRNDWCTSHVSYAR